MNNSSYSPPSRGVYPQLAMPQVGDRLVLWEGAQLATVLDLSDYFDAVRHSHECI